MALALSVLLSVGIGVSVGTGVSVGEEVGVNVGGFGVAVNGGVGDRAGSGVIGAGKACALGALVTGNAVASLRLDEEHPLARRKAPLHNTRTSL